MTSYAFPGAIFFTSSNMEVNSGSHGPCGVSGSMLTSSTPFVSTTGFFCSDEGSLARSFAVFSPTLGDATRDAVGSRLALRAAFRSFSAFSLAKRSCYCMFNAAFCIGCETSIYKEA